MNGWFLTIIILYVLSLGIALANHGKPKNEKHNFWVVLVSLVINIWLISHAISTGFN